MPQYRCHVCDTVQTELFSIRLCAGLMEGLLGIGCCCLSRSQPVLQIANGTEVNFCFKVLLSKAFILLFLSAAQAPLKPKTPRGTKTPINRNQLTQSRSLNVLPTKRAFEAVSIMSLLKDNRIKQIFYFGIHQSSLVSTNPLFLMYGLPEIHCSSHCYIVSISLFKRCSTCFLYTKHRGSLTWYPCHSESIFLLQLDKVYILQSFAPPLCLIQ